MRHLLILNQKVDVKKKFYLNFVNMTEAPYLPLDTHLTIGSEEGDYTSKNHGISPKHCSFSLNGEVITLIDHNSLEGTFLNGLKIPRGKQFILMENDEIRLGEKLIIKLTSLQEASSTSHLSHWDDIEEDFKEEKSGFEIESYYGGNSRSLPSEKEREEKIDEPSFAEKVREISWEDDKKAPSLKLSKKIEALPDLAIAGSTSRLFSLIADIFISLMTYSLFQGMSFFDKMISWPRITFMGNFEFLKSLSGLFDFGFWVILVTLFSTSVLGVTLGQKLMGIFSESHTFFQKRLRGFLRTIIGWVTLPFLVFDMPSLLSRRTLKEVITGTSLIHPRSKIFILRGFFVLLILGGLAFVSPFFQGLKYSPSLSLKMKMPQKLRKAELYQGNSFGGGWEEIEFQIPLKEEIRIYLASGGDKGGVKILPLQEVSLMALLKKFHESDLFWSKRFPLLSEFYKRSLRKRNSPWGIKYEKNLREELIKLVQVSFEVNLLSLWKHIKSYGPFIKPYIDFREKIYGVLGSQEKIETQVLGDTLFLRSYQRGVREFDIMLPLYAQKKLKAFKIFPIGLVQADLIFPDLYKKLNSSQWGRGKVKVQRESSLRILDIKKRVSLGLLSLSENLGEFIYGFYFEKGGLAVLSQNNKLREAWDISLREWIVLCDSESVQALPESRRQGEKLREKLEEMRRAFLGRSTSFFGVSR